ncbi:MAG: glycosyltransferase [Methylococcaceae bacterium]|jgi:glycosyltransferase involved in cell wall biosynthesis
MIRILFIISGLPRGGAETTLVQLLKGLDRQRFDPTVISLLGEGEMGAEIKALGIPLIGLHLNHPQSSLKGLFRFIRIVRKWQPDILQGWMYHGNLLAFFGRFIARKRTPLVFGIHNALSNWAEEKKTTKAVILLNAKLSIKADRILFPSLSSAEQHWSLGYHPSCSERVNNGVDCDFFHPDEEDRQRFREELGIAPDTLLIGLAARFHPVKDHRGFLDAARRLADQKKDVRFLLCGPGIHSANEALMALITRQNLHDRVLLLGSRTDMNRIYRALDVLVLSSVSEAFGGVLAEAMASGTPCVSTRVGIAADILGASGWLSEPKDPLDLLKALMSATGCLDDERRHRGIAARARIVERYNAISMVDHYDRLFMALVTSKANKPD